MLRKRLHEVSDVVERTKSATTRMEEDENLRKAVRDTESSMRDYKSLENIS